MTEEEKMNVFRNSVQLGFRLRMPESECVGGSSATSCCPDHPETQPARWTPALPGPEGHESDGEIELDWSPCPSCGSRSLYIGFIDNTSLAVICDDCMVEGDVYELTEGEDENGPSAEIGTVRAWNHWAARNSARWSTAGSEGKNDRSGPGNAQTHSPRK